MSRVGRIARTLRAVAADRGPPCGAVVLAYHDVDPHGPPTSEWSVTAAQLAGHIKMLRRLGIEIISLSSLLDRLDAGGAHGPTAVITFDDALGGVAEYGLPVLEAHGVPATIFAVSDRLGVPPEWWLDARSTMSPDLLVRAVDRGFDVAAHTCQHPSLPSLGPDELTDELVRCRRDLEAITGHVVDVVAYPFGHHDAAVRDAVRRTGYRAAVTFLNGRIGPDVDRLRLPRLTMGPHMTTPRLAYHVLRPADSWPDHQLDDVLP